VCVCVCVCVCLCLCVYVSVCAYMYDSLPMCVCIYVCLSVCAYVSMCMYESMCHQLSLIAGVTVVDSRQLCHPQQPLTRRQRYACSACGQEGYTTANRTLEMQYVQIPG